MPKVAFLPFDLLLWCNCRGCIGQYCMEWFTCSELQVIITLKRSFKWCSKNTFHSTSRCFLFEGVTDSVNAFCFLANCLSRWQKRKLLECTCYVFGPVVFGMHKSCGDSVSEWWMGPNGKPLPCDGRFHALLQQPHEEWWSLCFRPSDLWRV